MSQGGCGITITLLLFFFQIPGIRGRNAYSPSLLLPTRSSLVGLHFLFNRYKMKCLLSWNLEKQTFCTNISCLISAFIEGNSDLHNGVEFGWLYTLSVTSRTPYTHILYAEDNKTIFKIEVNWKYMKRILNIKQDEVFWWDDFERAERVLSWQQLFCLLLLSLLYFKGGPTKTSCYVTALYYTMTCMTSVGFGNVASETDNEKIFSIFMMVISGMLLKDLKPVCFSQN